ncbi:MAG: hypothetical protein FWG39_01020 [Alphaproteobacteria bacterium]|nr:hypothetical protein [Alphaproteobacteria bacterium]
MVIQVDNYNIDVRTYPDAKWYNSFGHVRLFAVFDDNVHWEKIQNALYAALKKNTPPVEKIEPRKHSLSGKSRVYEVVFKDAKSKQIGA